MRLYEFEGKKLLSSAGIAVPSSVLCARDATCNTSALSGDIYVKVQILGGNRARRGGIVRAAKKAVEKHVKQWFSKGFDGEKVEHVLIESAIQNIKNEHYISLMWDTRTRSVIVLHNAHGGSGVEDRAAVKQEAKIYVVDMMDPVGSLKKIAAKIHPHIEETLLAMGRVFYDNDATLVEINPLFELKDGSFIAGDAKIELDDVAAFRHPEWEQYPKRTLFARPPTPMEEEAKNINAMDHRGVAGASFFEFDGEIGIMASGGGASLLAMDALMASGLKPANYTEYSGNPSREKVAALTKLVLSKKGLKGLWVIGGNANFTDIYETLAGVMDGIEATKPKVNYPIVIRRGGPRWEEAFVMVKERAKAGGFDITLFGPEYPMLETTKVLVKEVREYISH